MKIGGLDVESTGFLKPETRIVEAYLEVYDWDPLSAAPAKKIGSTLMRFNPGCNIPIESSRVHGIYINDVLHEPTWEESGHKLAEACNECDWVVAHNGIGFDFPLLIQEWDRAGHDLPDFEPYDTMLEGRWATALGKVPSLQELCFACGIPYDPALAHKADYDVQVMMAAFFYGVRNQHFKFLGTGALL